MYYYPQDQSITLHRSDKKIPHLSPKIPLMKRPCAKTNTFLLNLLFSNLHTFSYGIYKEDIKTIQLEWFYWNRETDTNLNLILNFQRGGAGGFKAINLSEESSSEIIQYSNKNTDIIC